jgi:hypothetical protein
MALWFGYRCDDFFDYPNFIGHSNVFFCLAVFGVSTPKMVFQVV